MLSSYGPESVSEANSPPAPVGLPSRRRQSLVLRCPLGATSAGLGVTGRHDGSRARYAELLLISRLKASSQDNEIAEILERAAQIVLVTCKNWFPRSGD